MKYKYVINVVVDNSKMPISIPAKIHPRSFFQAIKEVWKLKRNKTNHKIILICYK